LNSSRCKQHAFSKQIELGAAEHLTLDKFDAVDVALDGAGTPMYGESGVHAGLLAAAEPAYLQTNDNLTISGRQVGNAA
jgi:hypothetical protein